MTRYSACALWVAMPIMRRYISSLIAGACVIVTIECKLDRDSHQVNGVLPEHAVATADCRRTRVTCSCLSLDVMDDVSVRSI